MEKSKRITISDLIQLIGALLLTTCLFFGAFYYFNGGLVISITVSLIIVLILYGIVYLISVLKKTKRIQAQLKIIEIIIFILGYGFAALGSFYFFMHAANIEFNEKDNIKSAVDDVSEISTILESYRKYITDKKGVYESTLNAVIENRNEEDLRKFNFQQNIDFERQKNEKIKKFEKKLNRRYNEIANKYNKYLKLSKSTLKNWIRLQIPSTISSIPNQKKHLIEEFKTASLEIPIIKNKLVENIKAFNYKIEKTTSIDVTKPDINSFNWVFLIPFILFHIMILWPYLFATSRSSLKDPKRNRKVDYGGFTIDN